MVGEPRARVFISCGQADDKEIGIAQEIQNKIEGLGFETPYIAIKEQDLGGVTDKIFFDKLEKCEYLIFIDFKREKIGEKIAEDGKTKIDIHRGSLFSHQELAVSFYLKKEVCAFREKGVKKLDGITGYTLANAIEFEDRNKLSDSIIAEVKKRIEEKKWKNTWRNELVFHRDNSEFGDAYDLRFRRKARWYHIEVINQHWKEIARDCVTYLESIELPDNSKKFSELVEFKWKGVISQRVSIPPKGSRFLDAFHVYHHFPNTIFLGINSFIVDYSKYTDDYLLKDPGDYKLNFIVFSENFSPIRQTFYLRLGVTLDNIIFTSNLEDLNIHLVNEQISAEPSVEATTQNAEAFSSKFDDYPTSGQ